jgi:hypothetical protein
LIKKFPTSYGTRRLIATFTKARHTFLSVCRTLQHITYAKITFDGVVLTTVSDHNITTAASNNIVAFDTIVAFDNPWSC